MSEAVSRPGAEGHRFGPDLSCSECGVTWDAHQVDPQKCVDVSLAASPLSGDGELDRATPEPKEVNLASAASVVIHARAIGGD